MQARSNSYWWGLTPEPALTPPTPAGWTIVEVPRGHGRAAVDDVLPGLLAQAGAGRSGPGRSDVVSLTEPIG
jgi:hypothetical protein